MANEFQSLSQRLRWLRQNQKPYMTQEQLAYASGVSVQFIRLYETGGQIHMGTETIQKLAAALGCRFSIRLKRLSNRETMEFPAPSSPLPPVPKRQGKISVQARTQAELRECSPWTAFHQRKQERLRKSSAETEGSLSVKANKKVG